MRVALLFLAFLILLSFPQIVNGLSNPRFVSIPSTGVPSQISAGGGENVAIVFSNRPVLGIYNDAASRYVEVALDGVPSKVLTTQDRIFLQLETPPQILIYDTSGRELGRIELDSKPSDMDVDGRLFVSMPKARTLAVYDIESSQLVEAYNLPLADGLNTLTASGGYVWALDESLQRIHVLRGSEVRTVELGGVVVGVDSEGERLWAVTVERKIISMVGWERPSTVVELPSGTAVDPQIVAANGKLYYASPNRRVLGVVENGQLSEKMLPEVIPSTPSIGSDKKLWFIDSSSQSLAWVSDSKPPQISEASLKTGEGVVEVLATVKDPEGDIGADGVLAVATIYRGVYVSGNETVAMAGGPDGRYSAVYHPPSGATKVLMSVVAVDSVGNRAEVFVGEVDLSRPQTTVITTVSPTSSVPETGAVLPLVLELLLVIPLLMVIAYLALRRSAKKRKKS
ncbi:hypothetical protein HRbin01_01216 [archaeon HR01]|nr:hypothetical protein HRbin01_01216 [archaeon HR01]